jgi:hypothetical protein
MIRKLVLLVGIVLLAVSPVAQGATTDFMELSNNYSDMQQSIAWLTEGLSKLGSHKDAKLVLTKAQKKKILPLFQALIDKKLVQLVVPENRQGNGGNNQRQGQGQGQGQRQWQGQGGSNQGGQRTFNQDNPQMQQRLKQMEELLNFGNQQIDKIDAALTPAQVKFVDNLDFNEEKYGFLDFRGTFGNRQGGTSGGNTQSGGSGQGFNQQAIQQIREKMRAGQEQLVKLNNAVLKMLKS